MKNENENVQEIMAKRIKELVDKEMGQSKSLREVAEELGWSDARLTNYTRGVRTPRAEEIIALANHYQVSCDYLMGCEKESISDEEILIKASEITGLRLETLEIWKRNLGSHGTTLSKLESETIHFLSCNDSMTLTLLTHYLFGEWKGFEVDDGNGKTRVVKSVVPQSRNIDWKPKVNENSNELSDNFQLCIVPQMVNESLLSMIMKNIMLGKMKLENILLDESRKAKKGEKDGKHNDENQ